MSSSSCTQGTCFVVSFLASIVAVSGCKIVMKIFFIVGLFWFLWESLQSDVLQQVVMHILHFLSFTLLYAYLWGLAKETDL
jgi:hypothetical protein